MMCKLTPKVTLDLSLSAGIAGLIATAMLGFGRRGMLQLLILLLAVRSKDRAVVMVTCGHDSLTDDDGFDRRVDNNKR